MNDIDGMPCMIQRRDILRAGLRGGGVLALGGVAALLGWRSRHGACLRSGSCSGCPLLAGCELPKAKDSHEGGALSPRAHAQVQPKPSLSAPAGPPLNPLPGPAASSRPRHLAGPA